MKIREAPTSELSIYARIPIAFEVRAVFDLIPADDDLGEFQLLERALDVPYIKDYDQIAGEGPHGWTVRFATSGWTLLVAEEHGELLGGAALVFDSEGVELLDGRTDLVLLWDLRVHPEARGRGIGSALFRAAVEWGRARGCKQLKVETQNVNVPASRFYAGQGCVLSSINRHAYPELPDEVQLLWYKDIG